MHHSEIESTLNALFQELRVLSEAEFSLALNESGGKVSLQLNASFDVNRGEMYITSTAVVTATKNSYKTNTVEARYLNDALRVAIQRHAEDMRMAPLALPRVVDRSELPF